MRPRHSAMRHLIYNGAAWNVDVSYPTIPAVKRRQLLAVCDARAVRIVGAVVKVGIHGRRGHRVPRWTDRQARHA